MSNLICISRQVLRNNTHGKTEVWTDILSVLGVEIKGGYFAVEINND